MLAIWFALMAPSIAVLLVPVNYHIPSIVQPSNPYGIQLLLDARYALKIHQSGTPQLYLVNLAHLKIQYSTTQPLPVVLSSATTLLPGILTSFNAYH